MAVALSDVDTSAEPDDELSELARQLPSGDEQAWHRLYVLTHLPLLRMLRRQLRDDEQAEEALQATYVTAVERIDSYDADKGTIDGWLAGIARYKGLELRRSMRTAPLDVDPVGRDRGPVAGDTDRELVALALDQLDPRYAEVLRRKYLDEQSLARIADELDMPQATVGTLIHRGRRRFRELYSRLLASTEEPHRR